MARTLFDIAWDLDFMECSSIIEDECGFIPADEALEYVCANYGD